MIFIAMETLVKTEVLTARMTEREYQRIKQAAAKSGVSLSTWVRVILKLAAGRYKRKLEG